MPLPTIIIVGNLTQDPELRFTTTGKAVASLRVACSERKKDPAGQWVDGDKVFLNVNVWNDTAENTTKSIATVVCLKSLFMV
jgi:single-strand DNA-binding protein